MTAKDNHPDSRPAVLIVDDKEILRYSLRLMLEEHSSEYLFLEAESGEQALEMARERQPQLILMDVSMPGMSGIEATRQIKTEHRDIVIIGLSMHVREDMECAMKEAGADYYISKDTDSEDILAIIEQRLQKRGSADLS